MRSARFGLGDLGASLFFPMLASGSDALIILAIVVGLVLHGAMYGPQAAFIAELFPTRIRYSGVSIAYQLTAIFAGSLAPIIALWLYKDLHSSVPVSIYVAVACAISGVSALLARETKGVELSEIGRIARLVREYGSGLSHPPIDFARRRADHATEVAVEGAFASGARLGPPPRSVQRVPLPAANGSGSDVRHPAAPASPRPSPQASSSLRARAARRRRGW